MDKAYFVTNFSVPDETFRSPSSFLVASNCLTTSLLSECAKHCLPECTKFIPAKLCSNFLFKFFLAELITVSDSASHSCSWDSNMAMSFDNSTVSGFST